jgi:hypothetical protein
MFIAFEGPDEVGKSTSATALDAAGQPDYNATKKMHAANVEEMGRDSLMPHTYDRIDWLTHMVYRLAMPERDWDDDRPRTVFAMPDTHLVLKMHHPAFAAKVDAVGEGYERGRLTAVNEMYYHQIDFLTALNKSRGYTLFKSISIMEVINDQSQDLFVQTLRAFDSPAFEFGSVAERLVDSDEKLLEFLQYVDHQLA